MKHQPAEVAEWQTRRTQKTCFQSRKHGKTVVLCISYPSLYTIKNPQKTEITAGTGCHDNQQALGIVPYTEFRNIRFFAR